MNRIAEGIIRVEQALALTESKEMDEVEQATKLNILDLIQYQTWQAEAKAAGIITMEEAMQLYMILGGEAPSTDKWNSRTLSEKITTMKTIATCYAEIRK